MPLLRKTLRDLRWHIIGYGGGLGLVAALYVVIFPAMADAFGDFEMPEAYSAFFGDIDDLSNPRSFLQVEFFSFWLPLLLALYAIIGATAQLAGDEGEGTLEMMLAQPVSRRRLFAERLAGLALGAAAITALASLGFLVSAPFVDLRGEVAVWELVAAPFGMLPFAFALIALALLAGTVTSTRGQAASVLAALTVAFYLMDVFADLNDALDPLRYGSFFFYGGSKRLLTEGPVAWHLAALLALSVLLVALALRAFEAREVGVSNLQLRNLRPRALFGQRS